jgi:protein TonB
MKAQETNMSINDIIFENRNKSYGAYSIRKIYGSHVFKALTISVLSFSFILTFPIIHKKYFAEEVKEKTFELVEVKLEEINIEHPELPPPPPVSVDAPPPQISMVKFLPPEVKPDNEIKDDEDPPTDEQLHDSNPGDKTQDGEKLNTDVESGTGTGIGTVAPKVEEKPVQIVTWVPEMPQFPGGPAEYLNYLKKHIRYPSRAIEEGIEGTLKVSFVVNIDGTLSDIKIINSLGHGLDEEAIRVFKKMPPWKPGKQNSTATPVRLIYPVAFDIAEEEQN